MVITNCSYLNQYEEKYMKKIIFCIFFAFILSGVYSQTQSENRWLIGTWIDNEYYDEIYIFNTDGSGIVGADGYDRADFLEFHYSISQTATGLILTLFFDDRDIDIERYSLNRINDRHFILINLEDRSERITLIKRN